MKHCPYCGTGYPDDATVCAIDQTPFEKIASEAAGVRLPTFAIFSEHKIPISLAILSYVWFLPAACGFAVVGFVVLMFAVSGSFFGNGEIVLYCFIALTIGLFFLRLSRGLRRCSPAWRTCTLVFIWCSFLATAFNIGKYLLTQNIPANVTVTELWLGYAFSLAWQAWQYRVLTRPDIRALFYA